MPPFLLAAFATMRLIRQERAHRPSGKRSRSSAPGFASNFDQRAAGDRAPFPDDDGDGAWAVDEQGAMVRSRVTYPKGEPPIDDTGDPVCTTMRRRAELNTAIEGIAGSS